MDTVTHGLTGWLIAKAVPTEKWGREAKAAVVLGSVLPDLDEVTSLFGPELSVLYHRGISHSFIGVSVSSLLVALLLFRFGNWKNAKGLYLLVLAGQLSHILLDLLNSYGTQILQPFSNARFSFDLLFVVDLAFTAIVVAGLWFARGRLRPAPARIAFSILAAYVGIATMLHFRAEAAVVDAAERSGVTVARSWALPRLETVTISTDSLGLGSRAIAAPDPRQPDHASEAAWAVTFPLPAGPFAWNGFVDDGRRWLRAEVDPVEASLVWKERVPHGQDVPGVPAVRHLPDVRTWLWFARFPVVEAFRSGADNVFIFTDLRYAGMGSRPPFRLLVVSRPGQPPTADWRVRSQAPPRR
jgi:membrane-bound metal-dependent hydrolase YbcI (DUF457 family)